MLVLFSGTRERRYACCDVHNSIRWSCSQARTVPGNDAMLAVMYIIRLCTLGGCVAVPKLMVGRRSPRVRASDRFQAKKSVLLMTTC